MRTSEISFKLRTWAERIRKSQRKNSDLLNTAADRLDDLDERIAIMTEHEYSGELTFPPYDDELNQKEGDSN